MALFLMILRKMVKEPLARAKFITRVNYFGSPCKLNADLYACHFTAYADQRLGSSANGHTAISRTSVLIMPTLQSREETEINY